ncbi:MAG: Rhodanese-like domain protein [Myxococcaceae bacterium]|nr:Rhodanese-like domain protein [Myxococcaceae bacterium]
MQTQMTRVVPALTVALLLSTSLAGAACNNDPAAGKPMAKVSAATEPAATTTQALGSATAATKYVFSNAGSKIEFVGAKVTRKHQGAFHVFSGAIELVEGDVRKSMLQVEIATASLTADDPKLTEHLKSADLLDVVKYPKASFRSTAIAPGGEAGATHTITGRLELHGVAKTISFPAKIKLADATVDANAEFAIDRKDFGIVYPGMPDDLIKDEVLLKLTIHGMKMPQ